MVKKKIEKIGILGGSFDPPHKGHLFISKQSLKFLKLKKVIWAITKQNPLKQNTHFSLDFRKKLCRKIIKNNKKIQLKHYENKIKSKTSIAVLKYLSKEKKNKLFFIIGSDNLINFHKWKDYKKILKISDLVVFSRKGFDTKAKKSVIMKTLKSKNIKFFKKLKINISSSKLRKKIIDGS